MEPRGLGVSKEVLKCDLDRAKTSIKDYASCDLAITPSNLKTLI